MMPERQKPSAGRDGGEKKLCFPDAGLPPPKAGVGRFFSAAFRAKGSGRLCDN